LGLEKTIKTLFTQLKKVAPIDLFYVALLDREEGKATFTMYEGDGTKLEFEPISIVDQTSLTRYVIEKGETVHIPNAHADNSEFPNEKMIKAPGHDEHSIIGVPLILRKEIQGVLFLQAEEPNAYVQDQIWLIETIANQASIAMDSAQLFEKVQEMAIKDSLTGVYNRRYFYVFAENEIARSIRYKKDLSLIMIDIDHFKRVNDKFGHLIGDQTLKMVTDACLSVLRKVDVLCRFGGEEFVVLLPETSETEALVAAERICKVISEQSLASEKGKVKVTVSIGITQMQKDGHQTLLYLVNEADQALYAAKNAGRNCVRRYSLKPKQ
jgi:diguanylate cyclase (GGDEF)-like protein